MLVHISKFDMYKSGKALYHVDRIIRENGKMVDNGFRKRLFKTTEEGVNEMCEVIEKYIAEGRCEGKAEDIRSLMESMSLTAEQAMKALKIPAGEFGKYMTLL